MTSGLLILLALHGVLSALNQFARCQPTLNRLNRLSLLPYWSFFAPIPGTSDHRVVFRTRSGDGTLSPWREVGVYSRRTPTHLVWNPAKHTQKCLSDCVIALLRQAAANGDEKDGFIQLSWPYIKLAQFAFSDGQVGVAADGMKQFAIVSTEGRADRTIRPLFVSRWHQ